MRITSSYRFLFLNNVFQMSGQLFINCIFTKIVFHVIKNAGSTDLDERVLLDATPNKYHVFPIKMLKNGLTKNKIYLFPLPRDHLSLVKVNIPLGLFVA